MKELKQRIIVLVLALGLVSYGQELPPNPTTDSDKNWTSSVRYDFLGNTLGKEVSFYNTLGNSLQSQSWDIHTDSIWASQAMYDYHGRPAIQTLKAPIGTSFGFNSHDFMLNHVHLNYNLLDYDFGNTIDNPRTVSPTSKLGAYYYNNLDDEYQDNTQYPFSRMVYSKLNPGSIKKILGSNKINGEWLQSYNFSMPAAQELSKPNAFGASSYNDDRIIKTVSRDVDGIETIVFTDSEGNTLAAARSGNEENPSLTKYSVTSKIKEQGYVDFHLPVGCTGISISNPTGHPLKIWNLATEAPVAIVSHPTLPSGCYRIAVDAIDFEYDNFNEITITYDINYYDYSLNTFDRAGRLLSSSQPLNKNMKSLFNYNSLGQLLETSSPDEGTTRFKYRKEGQIRFSQNSKQVQLGEVSFTDYDELGRPIKSGVGIADFNTLNPDTSILNNQLKELHRTLYDIPDDKLIQALTACNIDHKLYRQTFLYGNISTTVTESPFTNQTWYSYDVYGRVKWLVQNVGGLDCVKTINYSYDPLTGQITKVDYQRHVPSERFIHKYDYDLTGQLVTVSSSRDDVDYTENAKYYYTKAGTLRRTEIAENLQGIDYVYNINGQLKAINSPLNSGFKDPGNDSPGTNGFMTDVFGMILDYHDQDYTRTGSHLSGLKNTATNSQFNGNIGSIRWNNDTPAASTTDSYSYDYNKNNWLTQANFGKTTTSSGNSTFNADSNGDYKVDNITYDANGNIKTLTRNGVTNGSGSNDMDDFKYTYENGKNQLTTIKDINDNPDPTRYNDLKNPFQVGMNNYIYNEIGQLETNVQDQIGYEYNASGLVTKINEFSAINTGDWSMIYSQNFTTATFSENSYWVVDEGSALVNYNSYRTNIATVHCNELQATYGNSMGIIKPGNILTQSPGQLTVTRELTAMNGKLHQLSLDLIIKQIEHRRRLEPFDPNNPPPIVVLADNPMGYKVEVLDANQQVLATTTYNYPNPVLIDDPNLSDFQPCSGYYTNGHSLQFTPNTDTIDLKVTAYYDANVPEAAFYIDNIELEVAEAPRLAFYYNDRGQRVRKESYDNNGNTQRTIYVRDAGGSPMAIYEEATGPTVQQPETLKELPVYGAGRLGVYYKDNDGGTYAYQISDHLGNVRAVMIKVGTNALSLTNKTDYYPFGMPMPDRNAEGDYRYKYQGQEKDTETGKEAFELRLWDSRIGRWSNPDPVKEFKSPYVGMANDPISFIDRRGDSVWVFSEQVKLDTWWPKNSLVHFFGRHLFLRVKTDVFDLTIELQGPRKTIKRGDIEERYTGRTGTPTFKSFSPKNFKNGRGTVHGPVLVSGDTENFNFEYKVLNEFFRFIRKEEDDDGVFDFSELPDYNGYGPNSNGFVQHLLQNAGHPGLWANFTEKVGHVGLNDTEQYKSPDHNKINEHD